jgi:hypothetical protein
LKFRIATAVAVAAAGLAVLASPAMASGSPATPAHRIAAAAASACGNPNNICLGHGFLPVGVRFVTAKADLVFQNDGNLVDYDERGRARWASNTYLRGTEAIFQNDGNLVVYVASGRLWASGTFGHPNDYLVIQGDGNVVIYDPGDRVLWATHTNH